MSPASQNAHTAQPGAQLTHPDAAARLFLAKQSKAPQFWRKTKIDRTFIAYVCSAPRVFTCICSRRCSSGRCCRRGWSRWLRRIGRRSRRVLREQRTASCCYCTGARPRRRSGRRCTRDWRPVCGATEKTQNVAQKKINGLILMHKAFRGVGISRSPPRRGREISDCTKRRLSERFGTLVNLL